jgi:PilX N-terminal
VRSNRENGVALITALLILFLVSAIIVGMSWMVMTDQKLGGNNKDRQNAFYGAEAGMEKITADVGTTFSTKGAITAADITTITGAPPAIPGIQYLNAVGVSTYQITPLIPVSQNATVLPPSPYSGMQALITPLTLTVASQTNDGAEVKLQRTVQVVAIPVFQFGIYSDSDLSYFNGPPFDFGGRVHTNGNIWLAANAGPLYLGDKVTVVGQVIRTNLENGWPGGGQIAAGGDYSGVVSIATTPNPPRPPYAANQWRALGLGEGSVGGSSVYGAVSTILNNPTWNGTVVPAYNGQLVNGVPILSLTSTALGGITSPISLIRRPVIGELASNPAEFSQQYFGSQYTSLRILLDDYPAGILPGAAGACHNSDMMSLDSVTTGTDPIDLAALIVKPAWWNTATQAFYPLPISGATSGNYNVANGYWVVNGKPVITGCIKIEYQALAGGWTDITQTILNLGYSGRNINPQSAATWVAPPTLIPLPKTPAVVGAQGPTTNGNVTVTTGCVTDPSPNAIIRIARLRDNLSTGAGCGTFSTVGSDYWPLALFDTREGVNRPSQSAPNSLDWASANPGVTGAGVMGYIELDAKNLATWLKNNQAALGLDNNTGFTVYFSDRRGEAIDPNSGTKTGSYGYNDFVNNLSDPNNGCPNGALDPGEDLEGTVPPTLRTYGGLSITPLNALVFPAPYAGGPFQPNCGNTNWPGYVYDRTQEARQNSPVLFRRALKIVDGATLSLGTSCYGAAPNPPCGLSIAAENPVYIQGDYNAPPDGSWGGNPVAAAVAGDAVTLLSDNWNDTNSFLFPYAAGSRNAVQTAYRVALIGGKGIPFAQPAGQPEDFGTDGGLHNFLRFLETWPICYYEGSLVSFYYNHQAVGTYKTGSGVYSPPDRHYSFDANFTLGPQWLPPDTPVLRSINTIGFTQMLMPTQ